MSHYRSVSAPSSYDSLEEKGAAKPWVKTGTLFALTFALTIAGCSTATGVGGLFGPTQMITQDGTGCVIPAVPAGPIIPPNPAPFPITYKPERICTPATVATGCSDILVPVYATTTTPTCTVHAVTASGGPTAGGIGQWLLAVAAGIFAMVK